MMYYLYYLILIGFLFILVVFVLIICGRLVIFMYGSFLFLGCTASGLGNVCRMGGRLSRSILKRFIDFF